MSRSIVVLTAGISQPSSTRLLADQLAEAASVAVSARGESLDVDVIELRELASDLATTVTTGVPTRSVMQARERISDADGVIVVTPVFAASYSGLFKMFIDVLDPEALNGMPVLIGATAGTPRHSLVLDHALRPLFSYLRAVVVTTGVFAATEDFGDAALTDRIGRATAEFGALVVAEPTGVGGLGPVGPTSRRSDGAVSPASPPRRRSDSAETPDPPPRRRSGNALGSVTPFAELLAAHNGQPR
ncbi:oxidoreductase [Skermania sp. ID1734]|uniref:CE1759 family FMN reductase n=1 Tax=Skermania sp. ID1734 TaxID=2597516 RepID=UPI00117E3D21|nr:CE1759 family FMN reductase [Skermania sp. ID1734]TSD95360.1 oxidoreductase [Skermania sp. ID1734]